MTPEELLPYPPDDPSSLQALAQRCEVASRQLDSVRADLLLDRVRLAGAWRGPAARACTDELAAAAVLAVSGVEPLRRGALLLRGQAGAVEASGPRSTGCAAATPPWSRPLGRSGQPSRTPTSWRSSVATRASSRRCSDGPRSPGGRWPCWRRISPRSPA